MHQRDEPDVSVTVVRSSGIAGLRREWHAEACGAEAKPWLALIEGCPWDEPVPETPGADRFQWQVSAAVGAARRDARMPDGAVTAPWRALIDAVRGVPAVSGPKTARAETS